MQGWWRFVVGLAVTAVAIAAVLVAWPDGDDPSGLESGSRPPTTASGSGVPPGLGTPNGEPEVEPDGEVPDDLFAEGAAEALAELLAAAGGPLQLMEVAVYPEYLIVAYVDPAQPANIDRRIWRDGQVDGAEPNPIDDRVDAETQPALFGPEAVDLLRLPAMVADALGRYDRPMEATHVLIDRFLPFDERVLVRVYATPSDGRSGGGYVTFTPDGGFVDVCC